jgi:hypothetical protein
MFQTVVVEKMKTHILCLISPPENVSFLGNVKNTVESDSPEMTIQCDAENVRFSCRITKEKIQTRS